MNLDTILSLEHEYGLYDLSGIQTPHTTLVDKALDSIDPELVLFKTPTGRIFLANGMCAYKDMGLFEIALPECTSPYELLCYDQAAECLLETLAEKTNTIIFKNNIDSRMNSYGCHENYFYPTQDAPHKVNQLLAKKLLPFLMSRPLFTGTGHYQAGTYCLSSRILDTSDIQTGGHTKTLFHERNEPHCTNGMRIHVTSSDSNRSQEATYLKVGTLSLLLKMIEHGELPDSITPEYPLHDLQATNYDLTGKNKTITHPTPPLPKTLLQRITALFKKNTDPLFSHTDPLTIQNTYLEHAKKFVHAHALTTDIVDLWEYTLTAFANKPNLLDTYIDWRIKKKLIDQNPDQAIDINLQYHAIHKNSFFNAIKREFPVRTIAAEDDIQKALTTPPHTRALTRKQTIKNLLNDGAKILTTTWNSIIFTHQGKNWIIKLDTPHYEPPTHTPEPYTQF